MYFAAALPFVLFFTASALEKEARNLAVYLHNKLRSQAAKGQVKVQGGNMPRGHHIYKLSYSRTLEESARQNAMQNAASCHLDHTDQPTMRQLNIGQNIFWSSAHLSHTEAICQALTSFASEMKNYIPDPGLTTSLSSGVTGHFTQMIWGKTKKVGCAVAYCRGGDTMVSCNYSPPGNYPKTSIYVAGGTCKACFNRRQVCENGLCTSSNKKGQEMRKPLNWNHKKNQNKKLENQCPNFAKPSPQGQHRPNFYPQNGQRSRWNHAQYNLYPQNWGNQNWG